MFARTDRLLLRPAWAEDAPALAAALADEAVVARLPLTPYPCGIDDARRLIRQEEGKLGRALVFLRTKGAPRLIGGVALDLRQGRAQLRYWITRACWGLGYATEAGEAMVAFAEHGLRLPRLDAQHQVDNPAPGRVLAKLGFRRRTGTVPSYVRELGGSEVLAA